jgi:hypothetical protein
MPIFGGFHGVFSAFDFVQFMSKNPRPSRLYFAPARQAVVEISHLCVLAPLR